MEDFFWYGQVPLADFGSVSASWRNLYHDDYSQSYSPQIVFTYASAKTNAGTTVGLSNSTIVNLVLNGNVSTRLERPVCYEC